jgi:hypothetical protein
VPGNSGPGAARSRFSMCLMGKLPAIGSSMRIIPYAEWMWTRSAAVVVAARSAPIAAASAR